MKIISQTLINGEDKLCELTKNWDQSIFNGFGTGVEVKE